MQKKLINRYFVLIWFSSLCIQFMQSMLNNSVALYLDFSGFSVGFSGLMGLPFAVFGILGRMAGNYLCDKKSRRIVMSLGTLLMGLASLLFGLFPAAVLLLLFRGLQGFGFAAGQGAISTACMDVTPKEKGDLGVGILWVATALTLALAGYLTQALSASGQYLYVFIACALFGTAGAVMSLFCTYERDFPVEKITFSDSYAKGWRKYIETSAMKPALIEFTVLLGFSCFCCYVFLFADRQGYVNTGLFMLIACVAMAVSNLTCNRLYRALGKKLVLGVSMMLCGALFVLIVLVPCQATFLLGGAAFGMTMGFSYPILTLFAIDSATPDRRATATGTMLLAGDIGTGGGTFLWGALIDAAGFRFAFIAAGLCVLLGGVLTFVLYRHGEPTPGGMYDDPSAVANG